MTTGTNVAQLERWLSVIGGSALAAYGLKRRSVGGLVLAGAGGVLVWRGATGHCPLFEALGVSTAGAGQERQVSVPYGRGIQVEKSITIHAAAERIYSFWRNFENLPRFMENLQSVEVIDEKRSRWVAKGPAAFDAGWEAEIINEVPDELIAWRSVDDSRVDNAGSVHFTPASGGGATEVKVVLRYDPPAGKLGAAVSRVFGEDPQRQIEEDLRRLKRLMETGAAKPDPNRKPAARKSELRPADARGAVHPEALAGDADLLEPPHRR
ncbi:MAG TPA: SRPBCC family protein [Thermoanaerobaculia bacterium]|nr:SRPBCC family protein [Thermoanaerobaculia bacterium]